MKNVIIKTLITIVSIILVILIIAILFLFLYPGVGKLPNKEKREDYAKRTKYYYNNKFHNIEDDSIMTGTYKKNKGTEIIPKEEIPVKKITSIPKTDSFTITWLGHSSLFIQMSNKNILIDPVLTKYASPVGFTGSKRFSEIALLPENVPEIDYLLLSHDHYDHMDYQTIKQIDKKVKQYIVPLGVENYLIGWGIDSKKIITMGWWYNMTLENFSITATPSNHYSGRNPIKANSTWWCGYFISDSNNSIYYTGDSGYTKSFKEVYKQLGEVDVLLGDSGQYNESWATVHMNPNQDLQVAQDVHAKYYIPIHWGTFALSDHNWYDPGEIATENADKYGVNVITPQIGEYVKYEEIENYKTKWWEKLKK